MKNWIFSVKHVLLTLALLVATSCGNQPKLPEIPGVKGPFFNVVNGQVLITLKLLKANLPNGAKVPIPKTLNSSFEVSPNIEDGGTLVVFHLDIEDLKKVDIGIGDANTLPDGRPIPGVAGGQLNNSLRVDTELLDLSFYFHQKLFGFYVPLGWETQGFGGHWDIQIKDKSIGNLGVVASDNDGHGAGVILFLKLENLKDRQLQKLLRLSEKTPHLIY